MSNCRINIFEAGNVLSNKWVILELIGRGAMGEIYLAHQLNLKRDVAIKVVSEELLKDFEDDPDEIENFFQRFKREVHAMARVRHPNVLQIFDYGSAVIQRETGDCPVEFIAMEYIPGDTMRFTMSEEGFYPEQNLSKDWLEEYFLPVLDGIKAIHDLDIVHRDIKPENILMERFSFLNQSKWIWTGIVAAIVSMAATTLWHLMGEPGKTSALLKSPRIASEAILQVESSKFSTVKLKLPGTPVRHY